MAPSAINTQFGIPPATFKRWLDGTAETSQMLRALLERDLPDMVIKQMLDLTMYRSALA